MANNNKYLDQNGLLYLWSKLKTMLAGKVDKVDGKGLSTNDYTTAEKNKLSNIAEGANKTVINNTLESTSTAEALAAAQGKALNDRITEVVESLDGLGYGDMLKTTYDQDDDGIVDNAKHAESADSATNATNAENATKAADADKLGGQLPSYYAKATDIPTKVSDLENDEGYLKEHQDISGKLDKTGDGSSVTVTFAPASERTNVATGDKLNTIIGKISKYFSDLKTVAFTGSYNDLTNKPTIPTVTNDLTNELKGNYDAAYAHSQEAHAPSNAQANIIEGVTVNGTAVTLNNKVAALTIPTTVASLTDAADYAKKADITNVYKYKGSVASASALPSADNVTGDVYNVEDTGMNYAWNGTAWDAMGEIFEITSITNAEIDTILAS